MDLPWKYRELCQLSHTGDLTWSLEDHFLLRKLHGVHLGNMTVVKTAVTWRTSPPCTRPQSSLAGTLPGSGGGHPPPSQVTGTPWCLGHIWSHEWKGTWRQVPGSEKHLAKVNLQHNKKLMGFNIFSMSMVAASWVLNYVSHILNSPGEGCHALVSLILFGSNLHFHNWGLTYSSQVWPTGWIFSLSPFWNLNFKISKLYLRKKWLLWDMIWNYVPFLSLENQFIINF